MFSANKVAVVLFSADWAEQCAQILDVLNDLAKKSDYTNALQFLDVSAEDLSEISLKFGIEAVPTVLFLKNGRVLERINGVNVAALTSKCNQLAGASATNEPELSLNDRLKALINKSKVMIFMKGDRKAPRCGFSKKIIEVINGTGVQYETFDILSDEEVRQGLKTYSDWPTYPQVYVGGELIGGLDIINELQAAGDLLPTLSA